MITWFRPIANLHSQHMLINSDLSCQVVSITSLANSDKACKLDQVIS